MHITALDVIAPHARYKLWVKPNGEMPFLYGGNVVKAHVGKWSEDCPAHQGVVVLAMNDTPLVCRQNETDVGLDGSDWSCSQGFGVTARSTAEARRLEPTGITCFRQADVGEYLREVCGNGKHQRTIMLVDICLPQRRRTRYSPLRQHTHENVNTILDTVLEHQQTF